MPLFAVPLIVQDSVVLIILVGIIFGAGFLTGRSVTRRRSDLRWEVKMREERRGPAAITKTPSARPI